MQPKQQQWSEFAQGHEQFWRQFLSRQIPMLYARFMKHWPNPSLAEELVEKTVFDAVRGLSGFSPEKGSPQEWISGIAKNNIRLQIRRRAARPTVDGDISGYLETIDRQLLPDEVLERKETAEIVRKALSKLESKEQTVLRAKYIDKLSANTIAGQMNITEKAVHSLLYRARNSLRRQLKRTAFE